MKTKQNYSGANDPDPTTSALIEFSNGKVGDCGDVAAINFIDTVAGNFDDFSPVDLTFVLKILFKYNPNSRLHFARIEIVIIVMMLSNNHGLPATFIAFTKISAPIKTQLIV